MFFLFFDVVLLLLSYLCVFYFVYYLFLYRDMLLLLSVHIYGFVCVMLFIIIILSLLFLFNDRVIHESEILNLHDALSILLRLSRLICVS